MVHDINQSIFVADTRLGTYRGKNEAGSFSDEALPRDGHHRAEEWDPGDKLISNLILSVGGTADIIYSGVGILESSDSVPDQG